MVLIGLTYSTRVRLYLLRACLRNLRAQTGLQNSLKTKGTSRISKSLKYIEANFRRNKLNPVQTPAAERNTTSASTSSQQPPKAATQSEAKLQHIAKAVAMIAATPARGELAMPIPHQAPMKRHVATTFTRTEPIPRPVQLLSVINEEVQAVRESGPEFRVNRPPVLE